MSGEISDDRNSPDNRVQAEYRSAIKKDLL